MPMLTTLRMGRPVWPVPATIPDAVGEGLHAVQDRVHLGHHVRPVDLDGLAHGSPQGDVEDGPLLRRVDLPAAEHGLDALAQAAALGQLYEEPEGLVGDAMLGVVQVEAGGLRAQALSAAGVVGEDLPEVQIADLVGGASAAPSTRAAR